MTVTFTESATLPQAIKAVLPHASKNKIFPILNSVKLNLADMSVWATDRFTVAGAKFALAPDADIVTNNLPHDSIIISSADALTISKLKDISSLIVSANDLTVVHNFYSARITVERVVGDYPAIERLFPEHHTDANTLSPVAYNPDYLARFQYRFIARDKYDKLAPLRFQWTESSKPVRVDFCGYFVALLMPVRFS